MIAELNPKHGFEVWINQQLVETIETEFKKMLKTDELYYYYVLCKCETNSEDKNETKWVGKTTLIEFIKKVQKVDNHFCPIGVTSAKSKKELVCYFEQGMIEKDAIKDYWIGDVVNQNMDCGDDLFIQLWNRVRDQVTRGAITNSI